MTTIRLTTRIDAPIERCFDLARDIDLHTRSMARTGERPVAGVVAGRIGPGQEVTWEARHFGMRQRFTSRITAFDPPAYFQDTMVRGAFSSFVHDHHFERHGDATLMRDAITFRSPLGILGAIVDRLVLAAYLTRLIETRNRALKEVAERPARHPGL